MSSSLVLALSRGWLMSPDTLSICSSSALTSRFLRASALSGMCMFLRRQMRRVYPKSMSMSRRQARKWMARSGAAGKGQGSAKQEKKSSSFHIQKRMLLEQIRQNSHSSRVRQSFMGSSSTGRARMYRSMSITTSRVCSFACSKVQSSCSLISIFEICSRTMKRRVVSTFMGSTEARRREADLGDQGESSQLLRASLSWASSGSINYSPSTYLNTLSPLLPIMRQRSFYSWKIFSASVTQRILYYLSTSSSMQTSRLSILNILQKRVFASMQECCFSLESASICWKKASMRLLQLRACSERSVQSMVFTARIRWSTSSCLQQKSLASSGTMPQRRWGLIHRKLSLSSWRVSLAKLVQLSVRRLGMQVSKVWVLAGSSSIWYTTPGMKVSRARSEVWRRRTMSLWEWVLSRRAVQKWLVMRCCWNSVGQSIDLKSNMQAGDCRNRYRVQKICYICGLLQTRSIFIYKILYYRQGQDLSIRLLLHMLWCVQPVRLVSKDMGTHSKYYQVLLVEGRLQNVPPFYMLSASFSISSYIRQSKQIAYYPNTSSLRSEHSPSQSLSDFSTMRCNGCGWLHYCVRIGGSGLTIVYYFTLISPLILASPSSHPTLYISDYFTSYLSQSPAPVPETAASPRCTRPTADPPAVCRLTLLIISTMLSQDAFTTRFLAGNIRPDGREPLQQRQASAHFMQTKGHLLFKQGGTAVVVKTKTEVVAPRNERPAQGHVLFKVDCSACQGNFEEHRKLANQAVKLLETVVVGSKALDPQSLCILSGRYVWKVSVECSVCTDDGNILDCLLNGVVLALMDVRKPLIKLTGDKIEANEEIQQGLSLAHIPVSLTLALTEGNLIADPTASEQRVSKSRITVTMNVYKQLCSIHKPGGMGITEATLSGCVKLAEQRVKQKTEWLRGTLKERTILRIG